MTYAIWICESCFTELKLPWPKDIPKDKCSCGGECWRKDREVKEE